MAITGTGTQADPWIVHNYEEIKSAYLKTNGGSKLYIKLENDIDCNDYGDTWEWETISPYTSSCDYTFDLNGRTIKNIMIKSGNTLFNCNSKRDVIHNGKILNVFNNDGESVINGNGLTLKDISISVNGNGLTSYGFYNVFFENCAVYYKSSKLQSNIICSGSAFGGVDGVGAKNCDFYFDVNNMNDKNLINSLNGINYDNCRFRGSVSGASNSYYLLDSGKCINSVVEIDTRNMAWGSMASSFMRPCKLTSTGIINTEISPNLTGGTSGLTACTTAQMRDADYLNSIGFTVVKVGE